MSNGFSILEVLIVLTISASVLSVVITSTSNAVSNSKKITESQNILESIFHTVDSLKSDLTKCGMRLQEAGKLFEFSVFKNSEIGFEALMGISTIYLKSNIDVNSKYLELWSIRFLKKMNIKMPIIIKIGLKIYFSFWVNGKKSKSPPSPITMKANGNIKNP